MDKHKQRVFSDKPLPQDIQAYLEEYVELMIWNHPEPLSHEKLIKELKGVSGFITSSTTINGELLQHAPDLKVVSTISVGYNHFDTKAMKEYGVVGTHTPYVLDDTVADLIIGLMISAARRIPELDAHMKQGCWEKGDDTPLFGVDVHHKKLGIIGMGRIGERVAQRAKYGFDMEVSYFNRNRKLDIEDNLQISYKTKENLLKESDFIVLMVPLSKETEKMIGEREFKLMKKTAIFINASRGATVDEQALIMALKNGEILACGLDVYEQEPIDPNNSLLQMKNAVTLPHIGSATEETRHRMAMRAAKNIVAALTGEGSYYSVHELKDLVVGRRNNKLL